MKSIAHEISQRLLVLGVLLCLIFAASAMASVWAIKITVFNDWSSAAL